MTLLGVELQKISMRDITAVGVVTLIMVAAMVPLSGTVAPQTILAWTFAGVSGSLLAAMGLSVRKGGKQAVIVIVVSMFAALIGHGVGVLLLGTLQS